jgi:hypothetical protein
MSSFRRKWWVGLAAVMVVALLAVAFWPGEKEPEYQGKKLSDWLEPFYQPGAISEQKQQEIETAVKTMGTNCLPFLIKRVGYKSSGWRKKARLLYEHVPSCLYIDSMARCISGVDEVDMTRSVYWVFLTLRSGSASAIPQLAKLCDDPRKAAGAIFCLAAIGKPALPQLNELAGRHPDADVRTCAEYHVKHPPTQDERRGFTMRVYY